ncbi:hypothetical protein GCM10009754_49890 [Amycolatopsis minnesotensis]|uniref:Collagen triple helix repeat protein n=1 Tax=Amycolatopsis minnesotensis TaxID=337894 RepID=A0ABN2RJQ9_9PSEU
MPLTCSGGTRRLKPAVLALAVALAGVGFLVISQLTATTDKETADRRADTATGQARSLAAQVTDACARGGPAAAELGAACQQAAEVDRSGTPPAPPPAAVRTAVFDYCATHDGCRGPSGAAPDVDAIVNTVVAHIPTPRPGQDGRDGTDGHDGTPAPAITPDQIAAAVTAYCGDPAAPCRGTTGPSGPPGIPGAPGVPGRDAAPAARTTETYTDGSIRTCLRDDGSPDTAPTYTCHTTPPPENPSTPTTTR